MILLHEVRHERDFLLECFVLRIHIRFFCAKQLIGYSFISPSKYLPFITLMAIG